MFYLTKTVFGGVCFVFSLLHFCLSVHINSLHCNILVLKRKFLSRFSYFSIVRRFSLDNKIVSVKIWQNLFWYKGEKSGHRHRKCCDDAEACAILGLKT